MSDSHIRYQSSTDEVMSNIKEEPDNNIISNTLPVKSWRNLVGFWILGLCNNYGYVIMLSAAFDFLHPDYHDGGDEKDACDFRNGTNSSDYLCNPVSTAAILLADILPSLLIKSIAPFILLDTHYKVIISVFLSITSFLITSFSSHSWMTFFGVVCASFSSGLGEITFLSYSSYFDKNVVSTWSSGTGAAGLIGAVSYASLTFWLKPRNALLVMLIVPVIMCFTFWILIEHPNSHKIRCKGGLCSNELEPILQDNINLTAVETIKKKYTFQEKTSLLKPLLKYMIPLGLVYFAEYFINQGLMELLYFPNACSWLSHKEQYRWYQVDYQFGVLISRSSVNFLKINKLWLLPILQFVNVIFLLIEVCFPFIPTIWIVLIIIWYEGLLGGAAYVNTFYKISSEVSPEDKEFSMGIASLADSIGIALAGAVSIPIHTGLCQVILRSL